MVDQLIFPNQVDPFVDAGESKTESKHKIHIRQQQRTGRKCITLIEGLSSDLDVQHVLRDMRKQFQVNGTLLPGGVLQLQGDVRHKAKEFLLKHGVVSSAESILVHGVWLYTIYLSETIKQYIFGVILTVYCIQMYTVIG